MTFQPTQLPEVILLTPRRFGDARGWFAETWSRRTLAQGGITADFVQDNHSMSAEANTLRGLHYQAPPHAQDKLVRCTRGVIWDVAVDARRGSPRFGQWVGFELSAANGQQLFVPKGFLHGFVTRTPSGPPSRGLAVALADPLGGMGDSPRGARQTWVCSDRYASTCRGQVEILPGGPRRRDIGAG